MKNTKHLKSPTKSALALQVVDLKTRVESAEHSQGRLTEENLKLKADLADALSAKSGLNYALSDKTKEVAPPVPGQQVRDVLLARARNLRTRAENLERIVVEIPAISVQVEIALLDLIYGQRD